MLNVCRHQDGRDYQADSHLIEFPDGRTALIDAGDQAEKPDSPDSALAELKEQGVKHIDLVVLTHFHKDHYIRLRDIILAGITVSRVAINLPGNRSIADREMPWGCDWDHVQSLLAFLRENQIPYFTPKAGEVLLAGELGGSAFSLTVLAVYDGINTQVGETDINDTSIIAMLQFGKTKALFTGDLNQALGTYLATQSMDFKADILKVPHHGTEGLAPNAFFDRVGASVALVPAPKGLWLSERSKRPRTYFEERKIPVYVSGINGRVAVSLTPQGYNVDAENNP